MFCNKCGAGIPDGSAFCPNCGAAAVKFSARSVRSGQPVSADPKERAAAKDLLTFGIIALALSSAPVAAIAGFVFALIAYSKAKKYERDFGPATDKAHIGKIFSTVSIPLSIASTAFLGFLVPYMIYAFRAMPNIFS